MLGILKMKIEKEWKNIWKWIFTLSSVKNLLKFKKRIRKKKIKG